MFEFSGLTGIVIIALVLAYWWSTLRAKEVAYAAARRYCLSEGLQMLDDSLVQKRLRLTRGRAGKLRVVRLFAFEFTTTGEERYQGCVELSGMTVMDVRSEAHRFYPNLNS